MKLERILLLFCVICLISIASPAGYIEDDYDSKSIMRDAFVLSYIEHGRIVIRNDTDFANQALIEGWDGDGSPTTPYIIEGYNITDDLTCIDITDVSVYFKIRNCFVNSSTGPWDPGIYLYNASHVRIEDTIVTWHTYGIYANSSPDIVIDNCTITESNANTIWITDSDRAVLSDCKVFDNIYRIYIQSSDYVAILNNEIHDNGWQGLMIESSDFLNITGNTIANNGAGGFRGTHLLLCNNATIHSNEIHDNSINGVYLETSHNATISDNIIARNGISEGDDGFYTLSCNSTNLINNQIYENGYAGAYFDESHHCVVLGNSIYGNPNFGLQLASCEAPEIRFNDVWKNGFEGGASDNGGISISSGSDNIITENRIWNNSRSGIYLGNSIFSSVVRNEIFNNTHNGIRGPGSYNFTIIENQIFGNGWNLIPYLYYAGGIFFEGDNWRIEDNTIWNNTENGIFLEGNNNTVIRNRIWNSKHSGIGVFECYDNIITENTVFDGEYGIELVTIGTNVTGNIVYDNEYGICTEWSGDCWIYENDVGWNTLNAVQNYTIPDMVIMWYNNATNTGNWWSDYIGAGSYGITNGTHVVNYDLYPTKSLDLNASVSQDFEFGESGNVMIWPAQALNPSHFEVYANGSLLCSDSWDGNDIETNLKDLAVGYNNITVIAYHVSGHSISAASSADVTDTIAPTWVAAPIDQEITEGEPFSYQLSAADPSGIAGFALNDTTNFRIDSSGLITNAVDLVVGEYGLNVTVWDPFGNTKFVLLTITVLPAPPQGDGNIMLLLTAGAGVAVLLAVLVIFLKKRE